MYGRCNHLSFAILCALFFSFILGCSQSEDVIAPISLTKINLSPAQLPAAPEGYVYELWVVDTNNTYYSLGKFIWSNENYRFYDTDSNEIGSTWMVDYDILDPFYDSLAVSIENFPDLEPDSAGPIMLAHVIVNTDEHDMMMVFPRIVVEQPDQDVLMDFGNGMAGFCLETPTDKDSQSKEASGVWFALYVYDSVALYDTVTVRIDTRRKVPRSLEIDTSYWVCDSVENTTCVESTDVTELVIHDPGYDYDWMLIDTANLEELAATLDTLAIRCTTTVIDPYYIPTGLIDTFEHKMMDFEFVAFPVNVSADTLDTFTLDTCLDETLYFSIAPFTDYIHQLIYGIDSSIHLLDLFLSNYEEMPDLYDTKWHYKGWIISPYLEDDCPELGRLSKPQWVPFAVSQVFGNPDDWPIISTGSFKSFDHADDANPYSDVRRVPDYPGEDFILNLPCGDSIYFASQEDQYSRVGEIFITLEPDNYDDVTNFPLILFTTPSGIPNYIDVSDITFNHTQDFRLHNKSGRFENNPFGFPGIDVTIERQ